MLKAKINQLKEIITQLEDIDSTLGKILALSDVVEPKKVSKVKKIPKVVVEATRWHKKYDCCKECGTNMLKHKAKGLCTRCYTLYTDRKKTKEPRINKYECLECFIDIESTKDFDDMECPNSPDHKLVQK